MNALTIIAGPCSVDANNLKEIQDIANIKVRDSQGEKLAVAGTRVVGLKSRTGFDISGQGMGMDFDAVMHNLNNPTDQIQLPSIEWAKEINQKTGMIITTEIMLPAMQMALFEKAGIPSGKLLAWNPSQNQLGWPVLETAKFAKKNNWIVGLKNPKWIGDDMWKADSDENSPETTFEKTWKGMAEYASLADDIVLIHRGVDVIGKGDFRNAVFHNLARRTKIAVEAKYPDKKIRLFFDPSHSYGPKLKAQIPSAIVEAMKMTISEGEHLYDGILVETGTSQTDTEQHITVAELEWVVQELAKFRIINGR
jgi:3-deoxy-D-arabino-heptulosonate 7-phosphate (DAHP) synthase